MKGFNIILNLLQLQCWQKTNQEIWASFPFINKKCNLYICSSELIRFLHVPKAMQVLKCSMEGCPLILFKCDSQHTINVHWDRGLINTRNIECNFPEWLTFEILLWILCVILVFCTEVKLPSHWLKQWHFFNRANKWSEWQFSKVDKHVMDLATCKKQALVFETEEAIVSKQNAIFHIGIRPAQWEFYSATLPKIVFFSLMTTSTWKVGFISYQKIWQ